MSDDILGNEETPGAESTAEEEAKLARLKEQGVDALVESKRHADQFIEFLKSQNAEMKKEYDELLANRGIEEHRERQASTSQSEESTSSGLSSEDIKSLVAETVQEQTVSATQKANRILVNEEMKKIYGEKAGEVVDQKAAELGFTKTELAEIADRNPKAFFKMVGLEDKTPEVTSPAVSGGTVNTEALKDSPSSAEVGTWAFYQAMRKENKAKYYSPEVQQRLFKDAAAASAKGEDFYR